MKTTDINPVLLATRALNCSQAEFARRMGVSCGLVYQWKFRGAISAQFLKKAAELTGLPEGLLASSKSTNRKTGQDSRKD